MNKKSYIGLIGVVAAGLFAGQAFAITCPTGYDGSPVCINQTSSDGAGNALQEKINDVTASGTPVNVYTDQVTPNAYWQIGATHGSENTIMFEIAGNKDINSFGIFDPSDPSNRLQLFSGPASDGWHASLHDNGGGNFTATWFDASSVYQGQDTATFGVGSLFGYYLEGASGQIFYSDASMNELGDGAGGTKPEYLDGTPHMVAYEGDGTSQLLVGGFPATFLPNEFILAWEDQLYGSSDLDYNDFVVIVESVHPVPEPSVLAMFGLGMLVIGGAVGLRRRQLKQQS